MEIRDYIAGAAFVMSAVALFRERLAAWLFGPSLEILFDRDEASAALMITTTASFTKPSGGVGQIQYPTFYVRLYVANQGRSTAESVEISVEAVLVRTGGRIEPDPRFLPMNLKWSHTGELVRNQMLPGHGRYCDFLHIDKPTSMATGVLGVMDLEVLPATGSGQLQPGQYEVALVVGARNAPAKRFRFLLTIPSTWADLREGWFEAGFDLRKMS